MVSALIAHGSRPPIVLLVGVTGSGKSSLALEWAAAHPLEIVNLDGSQFYRGLDIGTAKPTAAERALVPHHLFDIRPPDQPLDAGHFVELADRAAAEIASRGRTPLFVGGTGLYARALLFGLAEVPPVAPEVRRAVAEELAAGGTAAAHATLTKVDPEVASRVSPGDSQRISRALEVFRQTGRPLSSFQADHRFARPRYRYLKLGLECDRTVLAERIARRVGEMFDSGFIEEVRGLLAAGYPESLRVFKALGYREVMALLAGRISEGQARERLITIHLRYAKRQRTWFGGEQDIHWFRREEASLAEAKLKEFLDTVSP